MARTRLPFGRFLALLALVWVVSGCAAGLDQPIEGSEDDLRNPGTGGIPGDSAGLDSSRLDMVPLDPREIGALDGILAVTAEQNRAVVFVNPVTNRPFAYAPVGWAPRSLVVHPDGRTLFVANTAGDRFGYGSISFISTDDLREVERIDLTPYGDLRGMAMTRSGTFLYIASAVRHSVLEFNLISRNIDRVFTVPAGVPTQLALDPTETRVFVTDPEGGHVYVIDLAGGGITDVRAGRGPEAIALSPDGLRLWIGNRTDGTVTLLDTYTLANYGTMVAGRYPVAIAFTPDGQKALVVLAGESAVVVFGALSQARLMSIPVGGYPSSIAIAPDGRHAWVASTRDDILSVIDLATMQVSGSVPVGRVPMGIAWVQRR